MGVLKLTKFFPVFLIISLLLFCSAADVGAQQNLNDRRMAILEALLNNIGLDAAIEDLGDDAYIVAIGDEQAVVTLDALGNLVSVEQDDDLEEFDNLVSCIMYEFTDFITDLISCSVSLSVSCVVYSITEVIDHVAWCIRYQY